MRSPATRGRVDRRTDRRHVGAGSRRAVLEPRVRSIWCGCAREQPSEVEQILPDRELAVDRRILGEISDGPVTRGDARRFAEHLDRARHACLDTHDRSHHRRLATTARPDDTDDLTGGHSRCSRRRAPSCRPARPTRHGVRRAIGLLAMFASSVIGCILPCGDFERRHRAHPGNRNLFSRERRAGPTVPAS